MLPSPSRLVITSAAVKGEGKSSVGEKCVLLEVPAIEDQCLVELHVVLPGMRTMNFVLRHMQAHIEAYHICS